MKSFQGSRNIYESSFASSRRAKYCSSQEAVHLIWSMNTIKNDRTFMNKISNVTNKDKVQLKK